VEVCSSEAAAKQTGGAYPTESKDMGAIRRGCCVGAAVEVNGVGRWGDAKVPRHSCGLRKSAEIANQTPGFTAGAPRNRPCI
jgi:hypothetical protein